ncbi:MAG: hypothetical protein AB8B80_02575 [Marinicellaceae bacterium]
MNKKFILIIASLTLLSACGQDNQSDNTDTQSQGDQVVSIKSSPSKLAKYMLEDTVCNALSVDELKQLFNVTTEVKIAGQTNNYSSGVTCSYNWTRSDAAERKEEFIDYTIQQMQGKVEKISMRQRTTESNISIQVDEYKGQLTRFVPVKLSEEQLQSQIELAKKRAEERLTDEQKKVAGDMANSMVEKMLRQNNNNEVIDNLGDGAYWSNVAGGGLNILSGNTKMFISLMIGDTQEEDKQNAIKIAKSILN